MCGISLVCVVVEGCCCISFVWEMACLVLHCVWVNIWFDTLALHGSAFSDLLQCNHVTGFIFILVLCVGESGITSR